MSNIVEPTDGQEWGGYERGDRLSVPRIGECEFYRYDVKLGFIEVFDKYGLMKKILPRELK